jgi:hypothetical protein
MPFNVLLFIHRFTSPPTGNQIAGYFCAKRKQLNFPFNESQALKLAYRQARGILHRHKGEPGEV